MKGILSIIVVPSLPYNVQVLGSLENQSYLYLLNFCLFRSYPELKHLLIPLVAIN